MLEKYRRNFESLTEEEATLIATQLEDDATTGDELYQHCSDRGLDQAAVVMSMARTTDAVGVSALEKLVGKPMRRPDKNAQTARTQQRSKRPRPVLRDDRIIRVLAESNPKKPGSKTYERFELYEDGMTVQQFREKGGTSDDVKWDAERGFIKLEDAQ